MSDKTNNNESFVSRWSKRKQEAKLEQRQEVETEQAALNNEIVGKTVDDSQQGISEELERVTEPTEQQRLDALNTLTDEDMPDLETLDESSDYAGFMSKNVSDMLRKMALRKLFASESYNVRDGLDEYDGDYTNFEKLDPTVVTTDMKHMFEVEAKRLAEKLKIEAQEKTQVLADSNEGMEVVVTNNDDYTEDDDSSDKLALDKKSSDNNVLEPSLEELEVVSLETNKENT